MATKGTSNVQWRMANGEVAYTIEFKDRGQDFTHWDIDKTGRVIACRPFQSWVWTNSRVVNRCLRETYLIGVVAVETSELRWINYPIVSIEVNDANPALIRGVVFARTSGAQIGLARTKDGGTYTSSTAGKYAAAASLVLKKHPIARLIHLKHLGRCGCVFFSKHADAPMWTAYEYTASLEVCHG